MSRPIRAEKMNLSSEQSRGGGSWLRLADMMGGKPEMAVLRRFRKLNLLRLLEMQSKLVHQEEKFEYFCSKDAASSDPLSRDYLKNWKALDESKGRGSTHQRNAWRELRDGLELYNNALMQQIQLYKQDGSSEHDLRVLRNWLSQEKGNDCALLGPGSDAWEGGEHQGLYPENDFVVLSSKHKYRDGFELWLGDTLLGIYHRFVARHFKEKMIKDEEYGLTDYKDEKVNFAADILCTLLAPLLVSVPMFVLNFVPDVTKRLGIVMAFTTLFSISLKIFSTARRIEVFSATSAFAAVQVVYVAVNN